MSSTASILPSESPSVAALAENPARVRIVAAARQHFFAHGFRRVTMDDLAEELGMSKKTLYTYFPSKNALLEAVLLDRCARIEADLDRLSRDVSSDFAGSLRQLLAGMQRHAEEIQPPFLRDMRREAPQMFSVVVKRRREIVERCFGRLFTEGRRMGFIRKDIPVKVLLEILLGAAEAVVNPVKLAELGLTVNASCSAVISVVLEGIVTAEGRAKL
jgi:AcrR family transcriptional regulator